MPRVRATLALVRVPNALRGAAGRRAHGAPDRAEPRRRRRHRVDGQDVDEGSAGRRTARPRCRVRQPRVVQQRVRAAGHAAERAGARARRRGRDGGAVRRRYRVRCARSRSRSSASSPTSASPTPSTSAGPRASPACSPSSSKRCPRRRASCSTPTTGGHRGSRDRSAAPVETVGFAPDADAPDHRCRRRPTDLHPEFTLGGSQFRVGAARRAPSAQRRNGRSGCERRASGCRSREIAARIADARGSPLADGARRDARRRRRPQRRVQRESRLDGRGVARAGPCSVSTAAASPCSATCASSARTRDARTPIGRPPGTRARHRRPGRRRHRRRRDRRRRRRARHADVHTVADADEPRRCSSRSWCGRVMPCSSRRAGRSASQAVAEALVAAGGDSRDRDAHGGGGRVRRRRLRHAAPHPWRCATRHRPADP